METSMKDRSMLHIAIECAGRQESLPALSGPKLVVNVMYVGECMSHETQGRTGELTADGCVLQDQARPWHEKPKYKTS